MNPAVTIWRRESRALLRAPIAWCVFAGFTAACGFGFTTALQQAEGSVETLPAVLCGQLMLTLCMPVAFLTMGLFATEKSSGTLETLMTAPVTDTQVVLGKCAAAFSSTCVAIALACLVLPITLGLASPPPAWSPLSLAGGLAAVVLHAAAWCALGTLISLLSRHQAPAGLLTLLTTLFWAARFTDRLPPLMRPFFSARFDVTDFARGMADTRLIFAPLSALIFLLFCAVRLLESRRWSSSS